MRMASMEDVAARAEVQPPRAARPMNRGLGVSLLAAALGVFFALAFFFRTSSLEALPPPNSDEAWYGVQAQSLLAGRSFALRTPTGNPVNPVHFAPQVVLLSVFRPSTWILRIPAALSGALAVVFLYLLGAPTLGRSTALISAALLAALPLAIFYSRYGSDISHTPLFSAIALAFAFRGTPFGFVIAFLACLVVHPTNLFLLPILLPVFAVQFLRTGERGKRRLGALLAIMAALGGACLLFGLSILRRPTVVAQSAVLKPGGNWTGFILNYGRLLLGPGLIGETATGFTRVDVGFWSVVSLVFLAGSIRLVRDRHWDRLALIPGLFLGVLCLGALGGTHTTSPAYHRYALFSAVPAVVVVACLVQSLLRRATQGARPWKSAVLVSGLVAAGFALLLSTEPNVFRRVSFGDSIWTFRNTGADPFRDASKRIARDAATLGPAEKPRVVISSSWWTYYLPKFYLAGRTDLIRLANYDKMFNVSGGRQAVLCRELMAGGYAVTGPGDLLEQDLIAAFPPKQLRRLEFSFQGVPRLVVYRLEPPIAEARRIGALPGRMASPH